VLQAPAPASPWLPDLCRPGRLATMLGVAELVVLLLALAPDGGTDWTPGRFVSASGFALWLALTVSVLLCVARERVSRLPLLLGGLFALLLAALVAAVGAALVHLIDGNLGTGMVPDAVSLHRFAAGSAAMTVVVVATVLPYLYAIDAWRAQVRTSARAEADALQARIRPHFLFNSMNTIASLIRQNPAVAERAVLDLSDLFRAALGAGDDDSSLAEEVALAERYLAIEQLRLGERLQVRWQREEPLPWSQPLPRLVLQPLLENAVLHGISRLPAGGHVDIGLQRQQGELRIWVRNPAPPPREQDGLDGGARHARHNIGQRLAYAYGKHARMTGRWDEGYYQAEIRVPLEGGAAR
jgi:two-component system sensor histidine kinase AlgZ